MAEATNLNDVVVSRGGKDIRFGDLPLVSQIRIVTKGINELATDSGAMSKEQVAEYTAAGTLEAKKAELLEKRINSLITGEFTKAIGGQRLPNGERMYRDVLMDHLEAHWNKKRARGDRTTAGQALPAWSTLKADKRNEFAARFETLPFDGDPSMTNGDRARKEADRRVKEAEKGAKVAAGVVDQMTVDL